MHRVAVFVDAGYLFAQGSTALTGSKKARADLVIDAPAVVDQLRTAALNCADGCSLLRIYWYDGATGGTRLTGDQALLANLDDVKVRLGFVNTAGQQKGVDSLIVTDLIELARQKAIHDAVLISGDEDVRIGVQIAQNYGVRVHLIGIEPARGSQAPTLMQEADTTAEWGQDIVRRFLSERVKVSTETPASKANPRVVRLPEADDNEALNTVAKTFVEALTQSEIEGLEAYWKSSRGLPTDLDKRLLPQGRAAIGQNLDQGQKTYLRTAVQRLVKKKT
ncbi:NYN domain-containing protein [Bradyrhizobium sp. SZCCHNR1020]|uniref:NYN domain-containing protein n=1 Tax=Bradyrhizobium sp. SZCCHNR1020 TaxID=3057343 RepID=UPI002915E64C|nr:NYN domain-containing protein [Bradyrhizobium sp. SZCCHNR1020]